MGRVSKECSTCNTAPRIERKCLINPLCDVVIVVDINEDVSIGVDVGANKCRQRGEKMRGVESRENVGEERKVGVKVVGG